MWVWGYLKILKNNGKEFMNIKLKFYFEDNNIIFIDSFNVNGHFRIDLKINVYF